MKVSNYYIFCLYFTGDFCFCSTSPDPGVPEEVEKAAPARAATNNGSLPGRGASPKEKTRALSDEQVDARTTVKLAPAGSKNRNSRSTAKVAEARLREELDADEDAAIAKLSVWKRFKKALKGKPSDTPVIAGGRNKSVPARPNNPEALFTR